MAAKIANMQEVAPELLIFYDRNAKIHSPEQVEALKNSIREFGFLTPCLIDKDMNLIAGHGRVMAARELGMHTVPCVLIEDLTEEQRRAYIMADNRLAELAEWDMDLVLEELQSLEFDGFDVSVIGFDFGLDDDGDMDVRDDDYDATGLGEPRVKTGDIYQLGRHVLICGDSTDPDTFQRMMGDNHADIAITSPPYNAGHLDIPLSEECGGGVQKGTQRKYLHDDDQMDTGEYVAFLCKNIDILMDRADEVFYNMGVASGSKRAIAELLYMYADNFKELLYWQKENPMPVIQENVISSATELIIALGHNGTRSFRNFNDRLFHGVITGLSASTSNKYADVHKATFPVYLPAEIITRFTKKDGSVLDCFGGTGTTMIACEQTGRRCYMVELEPHYCDIIIDRWEQYTGEKAVMING